MYAIKGSWVGQTFALATSNDSGGRKSRIRRSREERKAMVESFIKRYQILNDGNFPSLNLTHKEVGGSFYTVREIVREIIQENKVLGPARYSSVVQKDDTIAEDYSIGSSSSQAFLLSLNNLDAVSKNQESDSVLLTSNFNGHCTNHQVLDSLENSIEHQADEVIEDSNDLARETVVEDDQQSLEPSLNSIGQCVNENQVGDCEFANGAQSNGVSKESDEMVGERSLVSESSEGERQNESVGACNGKLTLPTKEIEVETFPLRPATEEISDMSSTSTGSGNLNNIGAKHNDLSNGIPDWDRFASPESLSDTVTVKRADALTTFPGTVLQQIEIDNKTIQHEGSNSINTSEILDLSGDKSLPFNQGSMDEVASHGGSKSNTDKHTEEIDGLQSKKAPRGVACVETGVSGTSNNIYSKTTVSSVANGSYIRRENKTMNGASPTVDRIDLGSWQSKKRSNQETNPLLAFFKAFVHAFAKFWSE